MPENNPRYNIIPSGVIQARKEKKPFRVRILTAKSMIFRSGTLDRRRVSPYITGIEHRDER